MVQFLVGLVIGLLTGALLGVLCTGLMVAIGRSSEDDTYRV